MIAGQLPWMRLCLLQSSHLAACSITELRFLRVLAQAPGYGFTIAQARTLLLQMKKAKAPEFTFIADDDDVSLLPAWVKRAGQTTDGHLLKLAGAKQVLLATLDVGIPGASDSSLIK